MVFTATRCRPSKTVNGWATATLILYMFSNVKWTLREADSFDLGWQAPLELGSLMLAFFAACVTLLSARQRLRCSGFVVGYCLLLPLAAVSATQSYWPALSLTKCGVALLHVAIGVALVSALGVDWVADRLYWSILALLAAGVLCSLLLPDQYPMLRSMSTSQWKDWRSRFTIFQLHPGITADTLAMGVILGALPQVRSKPWAQALLFAASLACVERGSAILLTTAVVLLWAFGSLRSRVLALKFGVGLVAVAATAWAATRWAPTVVEELLWQSGLQRAIELTFQDQSLAGRLPVWAVCLELAGQTGILGFGFDGFRTQLLAQIGWAGNPHNGFVEYFLACGLIGGALFVALWISAAVTAARRLRGRERQVVLGLHYYLFGSTMIGGIMIGSAWFGLFLLVMMSYYASSRSAQTEFPGHWRGALPGCDLPAAAECGSGTGA
jgi:hypothetical protein